MNIKVGREGFPTPDDDSQGFKKGTEAMAGQMKELGDIITGRMDIIQTLQQIAKMCEQYPDSPEKTSLMEAVVAKSRQLMEDKARIEELIKQADSKIQDLIKTTEEASVKSALINVLSKLALMAYQGGNKEFGDYCMSRANEALDGKLIN